MLTLRTMKHIRPSPNIKSFRSCGHATGERCVGHDGARIASEEERLAAREARRLWLDEQWSEHFQRAAGPSRVLPPSARSRQTKAR